MSQSPRVPHLCPSLHEITSVLTWSFCFAQYTAVLAESHPHLIKSRLAYMCLIIHEARKSGGRGWLDFDILFHQHMEARELEEANITLDWTRLDSSLHASYLVG